MVAPERLTIPVTGNIKEGGNDTGYQSPLRNITLTSIQSHSYVSHKVEDDDIRSS